MCLQNERTHNKARELPEAEQLRFRERKDNLALFKQRSDALESAVNMLEQGINGAKEQVLSSEERCWSYHTCMRHRL